MRFALSLILVATGSAVAVTRHATSRPAAAAPVMSREPELRASREFRRPLLRRVKPNHAGQGATPVRDLHGAATDLDVTMYCATGHHTASGQWPQLGMAAGNRWPFGTVLHIDGYGDVTITDRIGWGSDLDIYGGGDPGCERRALIFGRKHLAVRAVS